MQWSSTRKTPTELDPGSELPVMTYHRLRVTSAVAPNETWFSINRIPEMWKAMLKFPHGPSGYARV